MPNLNKISYLDETDWTNTSDIAVGESRKVEFMLVPDDFDTYEITATSNPLESYIYNWLKS